ncbi:MRPS21 [Cordylochernes scorpioides]|uniref:MRPS21 n=1 Tax=Cordylochernes scorpioides TaxID=51811 RepID=A0ABY6LGU7_9ARAC|nr:MRPS21 [Cordylochernes scorpioides]
MIHTRYIARTVLLKSDNVEKSFKLLNKILATEGVFDNYRNTRYYEKPYQRRNRVSFTIAKTIYNEDMTNRINFLSRKNREDPWTGY